MHSVIYIISDMLAVRYTAAPPMHSAAPNMPAQSARALFPSAPSLVRPLRPYAYAYIGRGVQALALAV